MTCIDKSNTDSIADEDDFVVFMRNKKFYSTYSVVHSIERSKLLIAASLTFTVTPFGFKFLNVSAVTEHNVTKVCGSSC